MEGRGYHTGGLGHSHGVVDPVIATTSRGIWAIKWSFAGLGITAIAQFVVFLLSGSVALFADTIHNVADGFHGAPPLDSLPLCPQAPPANGSLTGWAELKTSLAR